jgi:hypothetical protein
VSDAGCGSGTLRLRRKIPLLFGEEKLKTVCFDSFILKHFLSHTLPAALLSGLTFSRSFSSIPLLSTAQPLFKSFLARNEPFACAFA